MSTVILLSSSPPRIFARSPTPVNLSSPLPSTAALIQGRSSSSKKFKAHLNERDGFASAFTTARHVLAEKPGAENAFISSPRRNKFRLSQEDLVEETITKDSRSKELEKDRSMIIKTTRSGSLSQPADTTERSEKRRATEPKTETKEDRYLEYSSPESLLLERAAARRLDWTPPKATSSRQDGEKPVEYSAGLMNGMLSSFAYPDMPKDTNTCQSVQAPNPAKRRRVEHVTNNGKQVRDVPQKQTLPKINSATAKLAPKKSRSPAKKALTITALATSNYFGQEDANESPMMQYLTSTQAQLHDTIGDTSLETKIQKTRVAAKKLKGSQKTKPKSLLLSPTSAMKTYDDQEAIFGSASQLARDESPAFLRETIEAMRQSESFLLSDPFSSPQRTQLISTESTPQTGISRFRKTRNLWAAAGRDEDNALLHVDTIDLTDTPAIRAAFAGKDVMLQPGTGSALSSKPKLSLRGGHSFLVSNRGGTIVDICEFDTPYAKQTRPFSSKQVDMSPRKSHVRRVGQSENSAAKPVAVAPAKENPPPKPNYAGFTTRDLNKQITSYGFKAMRKREKMIELLDRCWEEKYGLSEKIALPEPPAVPFGDILSKVHDLSARPEPKAKKARASKTKTGSVESPKQSPIKRPRQRKQKGEVNEKAEGAPNKPKASRKRKTKAALAGDESMLDLENVWDTIPAELRELEAFDDWARPEPKKKSKVQSQPTEKTDSRQQMPPTPPATLPLDNAIGSCKPEPVAGTAETNHTLERLTEASSQTVLSETIASQITAAIMHQSRSSHPGRNHNINPTWHEKLLLYDPIILEDLASWLNTEGLSAISEDREVSAIDVREWCEVRGVCCLWRGGWRGNKVAQS